MRPHVAPNRGALGRAGGPQEGAGEPQGGSRGPQGGPRGSGSSLSLSLSLREGMGSLWEGPEGLRKGRGALLMPLEGDRGPQEGAGRPHIFYL